KLTRAHRITYEIRSNWKNVVDNYLECYHCPVAHKAFVDLFDMNTYKVTCHDVYSSHIARAASKQSNAAYNIAGAAVQDHAVWWMWPTFCLLRYPGDGNLMLLNIVPGGPEITYETYEFFFLNSEPTAEQREQIDYMDKVLQREDIDIVESIQRGMNTPAYDRGRYVVDPKGSGLSEHGLHHFHRLIFQAYESYVAGSLRDRQTKRA
ncbi:MAG: RHO alpha subunit C-terminal catalytic domain-containing protein, partial [Gammaproteobacteria bacterium]|nr:RHO alpha subunit C-terminal catalytic domain-containing protein [Gammaproteobacteria bacterium]